MKKRTSLEPEVKNKLQNYLKKEKYLPCNRSKKTNKIKELQIPTRRNKDIKIDVAVHKGKRALFIECKGAFLRGIYQGYGQILYYRCMFEKRDKNEFKKFCKKHGINPDIEPIFCLAYHNNAFKKYGKILKELYSNYSNLGIRTYIISKEGIKRKIKAKANF